MGYRIREYGLPKPILKGGLSVEEAIYRRRSFRNYSFSSVSLKEVSQMLWASQGITDEFNGFRSAPSAGATYPLNVYLVSLNIESLPSGLYKYIPKDHKLLVIFEKDAKLLSREIYYSCLEQESFLYCAGVIVITAIFERTVRRYGTVGERFVYMEVGHVSQNIYLQCVSLGIGTVAVGAFDDVRLKSVLGLPIEEKPLYLMPFGKIGG